MNTIVKSIITASVVLGSYSGSFAQASATAAAAANIITPIAISKVNDLDFGNVAVSASTGGTVTLSTTNTRTTGGGGITLPAATGTVSAAQFTISGQAGFTYVITLPAACTISDGSGHSMTVNSFASSPSATGSLSTGGTATLKVSATMIVAAGQPAGVYTSASGVPVTVNYN
jgi:hypothetical protein